MAFDPQKFLELARDLAERANDQAALRSAISRAYYAAFLSARAVAETGGRRFDTPHRQVWEHLALNMSFIDLKGLRLRRSRNKADYRLGVVFTPQEAKTSIDRAEQILEMLAGAAFTSRPHKVRKARWRSKS